MSFPELHIYPDFMILSGCERRHSLARVSVRSDQADDPDFWCLHQPHRNAFLLGDSALLSECTSRVDSFLSVSV